MANRRDNFFIGPSQKKKEKNKELRMYEWKAKKGEKEQIISII